jgi:integrase
MPDRVADALRRHRAQQAEAKLAAMIWSGLDLVFCAEGGAPLSRWRVSTILNAVTERSGLGKWQPREMRHTAISLLYDAGLPDERVGDVVGHAPGSRMTAGTYRHPLRESADGAAVAMNEIFGGVQSSQ